MNQSSTLIINILCDYPTWGHLFTCYKIWFEVCITSLIGCLIYSNSRSLTVVEYHFNNFFSVIICSTLPSVGWEWKCAGFCYFVVPFNYNVERSFSTRRELAMAHNVGRRYKDQEDWSLLQLLPLSNRVSLWMYLVVLKTEAVSWDCIGWHIMS